MVGDGVWASDGWKFRAVVGGLQGRGWWGHDVLNVGLP